MKVKCRKCKIEWEMDDMTFDDVAHIQSLECGVMGKHSVLAVMN